MLAAIEDIRSILAKSSRGAFAADRMQRLAIERALEIISEASRHIPEDAKAKEEGIPWQRMADLGNWLRHAYHRVDPDILWNIAINDLSPLEQFVKKVIAESKG